MSNDPYSWVWSVQAVNDKLYVTFADLLNPAGGGGGAVDVFDTDGNFKYQLAANGPGSAGRLQNPWGITQAPADFGAYSNDLLVGNVAGAGNINVYNPHTGAYLGQLDHPNGTAIAIKGLWDLEFGDGTPHGGKTDQLFFDAGPNTPGDATGGLFGVIKVAGQHKDHGGHGSMRDAATSAGEALAVGVSVPVGGNSVGLAASSPSFTSQGIAALALLSGAIVTVDPLAQPVTTGGGSTAGSSGDANGAFDIAVLTSILKKMDDTSDAIVQNMK